MIVENTVATMHVASAIHGIIEIQLDSEEDVDVVETTTIVEEEALVDVVGLKNNENEGRGSILVPHTRKTFQRIAKTT